MEKVNVSEIQRNDGQYDQKLFQHWNIHVGKYW